MEYEMKVGDKIKITYYICGTPIEDKIFTVEYFRFALGIFESEYHREAGDFTPLCILYGVSDKSEQKYIPNFGDYITNKIPIWEVVK